jgi:hypothetical protein
VADRILRALAADQPDFVVAEHEGPLLRLRMAGTTARSARATLEDLVACLQSAEKALELTETRRAGPEA